MVLVLWVKILWNTKGFEIQKHRILKIFNFKTFKVECFRKIYINSECIFPFFKTACNISCKMKYGMFSWFISLKSKLFFIKNAVYKLYYRSYFSNLWAIRKYFLLNWDFENMEWDIFQAVICINNNFAT